MTQDPTDFRVPEDPTEEPSRNAARVPEEPTEEPGLNVARVPEEPTEERGRRLEGPPVPRDAEWRRLDPRMLLVHPVNELLKFLPVLIGIFLVGSAGGNDLWQLVGVALPIVLGVMRFLTTRFRITATQVELQRGLLSRSTLTAKLDRVRAVELTSSPIHQLLGLAKVEIGTASAAKDNDERFALDGLPLAEARELRVALLHRADEDAGPSAGTDVTGLDRIAGGDEVLLRFDPRWVRYAPLTASGSVVAVAVLAAMGQFTNGILARLSESSWPVRYVEHHPVASVVLALVAFLVLGAVFSVLGYLVQNWGFTLARDVRGRSYHVHRGLLTTRETSLEVERVRGLEVGEPLGLRLAGAARLSAIVTGVSKKESGTTLLVPTAPRGIVQTTGSSAIGTSEPLHATLRRHGPRARRRRYTRALVVAAVLPGVVLVLALTTPLSGWFVLPALLTLPAGAVLAADRYRGLGHTLTDEHLVVRSGSFTGRRDVLQRTGIIGWNLRQTWFQRRSGLATLVATTAAGHQAYTAVDIPLEQAVAIADEAVPGLLTPFLVTPPVTSPA
ncbi:MAG: PH domain-containing protein [Marmoricola sp.]|nr:PH domain-containing protein [Marmoricola sp.]